MNLDDYIENYHLKYYYDKGDVFIGTFEHYGSLSKYAQMPPYWDEYILITYPYTSNPRTEAVETSGERR